MERLEAYVPDLALGWAVDGSTPWSTRHASMMFADLSGFTKLSERVARVKGAGAEVVKRTINAVFEPCIDAVLREGGDVVKFAGDGLMMMFEGEGHELAAARAAVALQRAVQRIGRVDTPAGPARIGVSIGISTGDYLCLLSRVGRLEPVVVGPALDEMFAAEAFAKSGQVVVDDRLAAVLPAGCTRPVRGSGRRQLRLDAPDLASAGSEPRRGPAVRSAADFLDPRVRSTIETGDTPPEHRSAAIAFLALDGLAAVRTEAGVAGLHAHVERFLGAVAEACAATDACWLESDSDRDQVRVLLTAGAPYRTDVDEQRMLDTVWRVHEATGDMAVRTGVSRGKVFVGDVGHPLRRTYNVMGDAVNVAARLAGKAARGEVLALATVARARRSMARAEPRAPLAVKGKRLPLEVCNVLGLAASDEVTSSQPSIGRSAELARLAEALAAVAAGRGRVVTVVGDAGMGSSHLVSESLAGWTGAVARTRGHEFERSTPFAAISRLVRGVLGIEPASPPEDAGAALAAIVTRAAPELVERLPLLADVARAQVPPTAVVDAIRPEFRVEQAVVAAVALLRAVAMAPLVLVAEDVDRFDASSSSLLASLAVQTGEAPWLLVRTTHVAPTGDDVPAHGEVVHLAPLHDDDVRQLVLATVGDVGLTTSALDGIVRQAGGNPMIASELSLGWVAGARDVELPDAVERAVASRIDNLPPDARTLMRDLSVAGSGAEWSLVTEVLGAACDVDTTWSEVRGLVAREAGSVAFERDIYATAAYQGLAHERRRTLHRAFAQTLARRPYARFEAARIAEHAHGGGDPGLAWEWSLAAAEAAEAAGSAEDAAVHLAHAVAAADGGAAVADADRLAVLERLGDAHERAGHPDDAHAAYRRARALVVEGSASHLRLLRKHARVAERAGAWTSSLRWVTKGVALASAADADRATLTERAELELAASVVRFFQGRTRVAADLARGAVEHAERAGADRAIAQAELQLEMCCSVLGLPERAAHGLRALELFELLDDHLGLANLRLNLGADCYAESRWDQALHHYRRSTAEYAVVGDLVGAALTENNRAEILTDQGRDDEALRAALEARRGFKAAAYRMGVASTSSSLGRLALRRGDLADADRWYGEARGEFVALDAAPLVADTDVRLLELDLWRGELRAVLDAVDRVQAFVDEAEPSPMLRAGIARLQAWALTGPASVVDRRRRTRVQRVWDEAVAVARREAFPYEVALALDARCAVLDVRADDPSAAERDDLFRRLGVVRPPRPPWMATVTHSSGT